MKILSAAQIREADRHTIEHEPIASLDLMERASLAFTERFQEIFPAKTKTHIFCGIGNNGGDGLAVARLLREQGWDVDCFVLGDPTEGSLDFKSNLEKVPDAKLLSAADMPKVGSNDIVIDALFGSGLSRELEGKPADLVKQLNDFTCHKVAIDIASGLFADVPTSESAVVFETDYTISFQLPKLSFFMPGAHSWVGEWHVVDIGLHSAFINRQETLFHFMEHGELQNLVPVRSTFAHKSQVGHLLVVAGSRGKMGAAALCAAAALRSGVGLINVHLPRCGTDILQVLVPEAMVNEDAQDDVVSEIEAKNHTIVIGPGLGTDDRTVSGLKKLLAESTRPIVFDADALNIIGSHALIESLPKGSILTPHPGEFRRLVGDWANDFEKLEKLKELCVKHNLNVVLKGAYSAVCDSDGKVFFNSSGNPGMATAGSGDVLAGMVGSFLAQGLKPNDALKLGVFLHGVSGDLAAAELGQISMTASDIISQISNSFATLGV